MSGALKLNVWPESHPLVPEGCPCDLHFCDYVDEKNIQDHVVFHFGTGEHHIIARRNMALSSPNHVLGVTASVGEYDAYIKYVTDDPLSGNFYNVIFLDNYSMSGRMLPNFDIVTLFHLGEFYDERNARYAPLDDTSLVDLLLTKMNPHGRMMFYKGSWGAEKTRPIIKACVDSGKLVLEEDYKSLLVYRLA